MRILLDLIYAGLAIVTAPLWMRKARTGWGERFGRIEPLPPKSRPRILLHAVSVGEVNLIRKLVSRLAESAEVVVSVTTDTGIARARQLYESTTPNAPAARVVRYPLDLSWSVKRFLRAVDPDAVGLVELELWPNFLSACAARGTPVAVINGRLSERSFKRYYKLRRVFGRWFDSLAFAAVQDAVYAERFEHAGVTPGKCLIAGSMKWDAADVAGAIDGADRLARELGVDRSRPLIVAGSTAPEEHALLHRATPPGAQLLCAPRRPEWFDDAARDLPGCVRRSQTSASDPSRPADRFLLDTIGELRLAYSLADIVVIGRSFGQLYGSDPMEPAALEKPVVIGPAVTDFKVIVDTMLAAEAIVQTTSDELPAVLARLADDPGERQRLAANARRCVLDNQGATDRHALVLLSLLASSAPDRRAIRRDT